MCLQKLSKLFLGSCLFLALLMSTSLHAGTCSKLEILKSEDFQVCQEKLVKYVEANDDLSEKLGRCKVEAKEEMILWVIPAKDVANIALGFAFGIATGIFLL